MSTSNARTSARPSAPSPTFPGLWVFSGADQYRVRLSIQAALDRLLSPETRDFNHDRTSAKAIAPAHLLSLLGTPPMMAEQRVVQLDDAEALSAEAVRSIVDWATASRDRGEREIFLLLAYGEKSPPKALLDLAGTVKVFETPERREAVQWVQDYARRKHQVRFAPDLAERLVERTGILDSGKLAHEVDKLLTLASGRALTAEDIDGATEAHVEESVFRFYDAIGDRKFAEACDSLGRLLLMPEHDPIPLAAAVATHLLGLGLGAALREAGKRRAEIEPILGRGFYGAKLARQSEKWTRPQVDRALMFLREADLALKSGENGLRTLETFLARALLLDVTPLVSPPTPSISS